MAKNGYVVGVDIEGYPTNNALKLGYKEAHVWGNNYHIPTDLRFDFVTIINLNAHVNQDDLLLMVKSAKKYCNKNAEFIFINEYNNDNLLYSFMKKKKYLFDEYVENCEHHFFHYQDEFEKLMEKVDYFEKKQTEVLAANPSFMHVLASRRINHNYFAWRIICLFCDIIISQINNMTKSETGFIVAHIYKFKN